jgi:hypothetical protein
MDLIKEVARLRIYIEKCKRQAEMAVDKHLKAFMEREIAKAERTIAKLLG